MSDYLRGLPDSYDQWRTHSGEPREIEPDEIENYLEGDDMDSNEKLRRALAHDWEFVGDPWQLCQILRAEVHRLRAKIQLAECQHLGCGGKLTPDEVVTAMRDVLNSEA